MDPAHHAHGSPSLPLALLRHTTSIATRLSILLAKTIATAFAMFLIPRTIHITVHCLDDLYEMLGRRARSPWETQTLSGYGAFGGLAIMLLLHKLLNRIGYNVILNEDLEGRARQNGNGDRGRDKKVTWERVLVRVVIPLFLDGGLLVMGWNAWEMGGRNAREVVRANTVDLEDDKGPRLVWRDR